MSEEEIKENIKDFLELREIHSNNSLTKSYLTIYQEAIQGLLDLYNKEKKKNKELEEENRIFRKQINDAFDRGWIHKDKIKAEKANTNKLIRYIALKENKDYEQVKEEFEI